MIGLKLPTDCDLGMEGYLEACRVVTDHWVKGEPWGDFGYNNGITTETLFVHESNKKIADGIIGYFKAHEHFNTEFNVVVTDQDDIDDWALEITKAGGVYEYRVEVQGP